MTDRLKMQDPRKQYPSPPFPKQPQPAPGLAREMDPKPDHGEESYKGSGRLAGRKALITGRDSGIGRAAAIAYAREGADVAIGYLPEEEADAKQVIALIEAEGRKALGLAGDVKDEAWCKDMVQRTVDGLGGLDILVINAARQQFRESVAEVSTDDFDQTMKTNSLCAALDCPGGRPAPAAWGGDHHDGIDPGLRTLSDPLRLRHHKSRHRRLYQGAGQAGDREGHSRQCRCSRPVLDRVAAQRWPTRREGSAVRQGQRLRPARSAG